MGINFLKNELARALHNLGLIKTVIFTFFAKFPVRYNLLALFCIYLSLNTLIFFQIHIFLAQFMPVYKLEKVQPNKLSHILHFFFFLFSVKLNFFVVVVYHSVNFNTWLDPCNYYHNWDIKQFYHLT